MKRSRSFFVPATLSVVLAGFVFFGCSDDTETKAPCEDSETCMEENSSSSDGSGEPYSSSSVTSSSSANANPERSSSSEDYVEQSSDGNNPESSASVNSSSSSRLAVSSSSATNTVSSSSVATQPSSSSFSSSFSSSNLPTPSSSSVASTGGTGAPGNCAAPNYGVPPYGTGSCIRASNGECYTCNPDRGNDCNQGWIYQLGNPSDTYWYSKVSCGSTTNPSSSSQTSNQSSSSITNTNQSSSSSPNLTCATVSQSITVGQTPSLPAVGCGSTTLNSSQLTFNPDIKVAQTSAKTITGLTVSASCGGSTKTASCPGTITVTAAPSSSSGNQGGGGTNDCGSACDGTVSGGSGFTTRYWDSCKPSCAWTANASGSPNGAARTCNVSGTKLTTQNDRNACESGGTGYTCADQYPWAINDDLAYGYAASHTNSDCGKCYLLQFTDNGEGFNSGSIIGKKMVIMISNIGGDVSGTQFDLLIPGGGVGQFNAFSNQISQNGGPSSPALGQTYGGFRATCGNNVSCIRDMCTAAFGSNSSGVRGDFMKGCNWYIDWFKISNNPKFNSKQITCPASLVSKYRH